MTKSLQLTALLVLGLSAGLLAAVYTPQPENRQTVEWLAEPRDIAAFDLQSEFNRFGNHSLKDRWTIMTFGFMNCPDICPTSLSQMADLATENESVNYVFVSIDPNRDSFTDLNAYVSSFHSSIVGVTGNVEQLHYLTDSLGVQFKVDSGNDYNVAHSITFSIIDPEGRLRGRFRPGFATAEVARELRLEIR